MSGADAVVRINSEGCATTTNLGEHSTGASNSSAHAHGRDQHMPHVFAACRIVALANAGALSSNASPVSKRESGHEAHWSTAAANIKRWGLLCGTEAQTTATDARPR